MEVILKTSCMSNPERQPLVILRKPQVEFCQGNQCAALVLSFLEYWHNWKLASDEFNKKSNDIAEMHGDHRSLSEDVYQYHTLAEISDGIMNLYGTKKISASIKLLESLGVISTHKNPNPKYRNDRTTYFRLYPEVYNNWIKLHYSSDSNNSPSEAQKGIIDTAKMPPQKGKKELPSGKNASPITEINYRDINKSIKERDNFVDKNLSYLDNLNIQHVIDVLIQKGIRLVRMHFPYVEPIIQDLCLAGATPEIFAKAYDISVRAASSGIFGISYVCKVVDSLLKDKNRNHLHGDKSNSTETPTKITYEHDFSGGLDWMGDLVS